MCLYNYRNDLHFHWSGFNSWYSRLCQSLQCHLCILGIRLPAGPHLSDTSLLLGCHQSQLPGEQLRLERARHRSALHGWMNKPHFLVLFILFRFQGGHVQRSGTSAECLIRSVWKRCVVCLKRCVLEIYLVTFVSDNV